jgi:hypothetical protein
VIIATFVRFVRDSVERENVSSLRRHHGPPHPS